MPRAAERSSPKHAASSPMARASSRSPISYRRRISIFGLACGHRPHSSCASSNRGSPRGRHGEPADEARSRGGLPQLRDPPRARFPGARARDGRLRGRGGPPRRRPRHPGNRADTWGSRPSAAAREAAVTILATLAVVWLVFAGASPCADSWARRAMARSGPWRARGSLGSRSRGSRRRSPRSPASTRAGAASPYCWHWESWDSRGGAPARRRSASTATIVGVWPRSRSPRYSWDRARSACHSTPATRS